MEEKKNMLKLIDFLMSELAVLITPIIGGLAFYLAINISWKYFPAILLALVPFGVGCMGIKRLAQIQENKKI